MKQCTNNILYALSFFPLALKIPYILGTFKSSPLERGNIFICLALPFIAALCEMLRRNLRINFDEEKCANTSEIYLSLISVAASTALYIWAESAGINAAGILAAIFIIASATALRFGKNVFKSQIPTFFAACISTPSVGYWLDYYLSAGITSGVEFFAIKILAATLFCAFWIIVSIRLRRYPTVGSTVFVSVAMLALLYCRAAEESKPEGLAFSIDTTKIASNDWISDIAPAGKTDERDFKGCSQILRKNYYDRKSSVGMLALEMKCGASIHPIGICLKSSGVRIKSSKQISISIGGRRVQINELVAEKSGVPHLIWNWFTNGEISTGDFAKYRFDIENKVWRNFQLMTRSDESFDSAKKRLLSLVENFSEEYTGKENAENFAKKNAEVSDANAKKAPSPTGSAR